jgi:ATP/maltotriose-dependent transcriptional regulator MalT
MAAFASQAHTVLDDREWMLQSIYQLNLALADWLRGRLDDAERGFISCIAGWRSAGERALAAGGCNFLGQVQRAQGRLDVALSTYDQLVQIGTPPGVAALPVAGIGYVGTAEVEYQRNELEAALSHVTDGIALCRHVSDTQPVATGLATLAWIRWARGDQAAALETMEGAARAGPSPAASDLLNPVPAHRARLLLAQGDLAAATRWTEEKGLSPDGEPVYATEREYLVLARVLLAQDLPSRALALLERMSAAAQSQDRTGSLIEIQALQALAHAQEGDEARAVRALVGALRLGCSQGYVRVFADEGAPMGTLLGLVVAAQREEHATARLVPLSYLATILRAFDPAERPAGQALAGAGAAGPGMAEPLTSREMEVLGLLAAGTPNRRIAQELVVTIDTVKKHVTHVLGKLGAANRTEAVTRARQLGMIP